MGKRSREKRERRLQRAREQRVSVKHHLGLEKVCFFIIQWGTYLVLFAPLVVVTSSFFPFVTPKTIFFRIIIEVILIAYLFLAIAVPSYRPKVNALTIGIIIFLGVLILTSFTGVNLERSLWSTYERMTGLWTIFHLFIFFIILSSVFRERKEWERILGVSVLVGVFLSLYVLVGPEAATRGGGTIGNSSFMGAYLLFSVFFAIILVLTKRGAWQIFSGVSLMIMLIVLLTSSARGAIASFLGGIFLLSLGYLIFSQKRTLKRAGLIIILVLIVLGITLAILQPPFVKNKIKTILRQMKPRFVVWEKGLKGFQERPILGWGPENFNVVFTKYFNPCMFLSECGGEIWFDRTHNIILDTLVTSGLIGLISYLSIFGIAIFGLLKILPKIAERKNIFLPLGMAVLLVVYFVQNLLVFDMINTYMMFFLCLAFISFLIYPVKFDEVKVEQFNRVNPLLGIIIISVIGIALWFGNIQPAQSAFYIAQMVNPNLKIEETSDLFKKSLRSPMLKYEAREQFAKQVSLSVFRPNQDKKALREAFELATEEMKKSTSQNPLDFRPHLFLGKIYIDFYDLTQDKEKLNLAEKFLKKAIELSPKNQQGYWNLAQVRIFQGKHQDALDLFQKAIDLEPRLGKSHWYLVLAYKANGQYHLAKEKLANAEKAGYNWRTNLDDLKKVIDLHIALNDNLTLISLYQEAIEIQPKDPQLWGGLAAAYARLGEKEKAREAAAKVVEIDPNLISVTEKFLKELEQDND